MWFYCHARNIQRQFLQPCFIWIKKKGERETKQIVLIALHVWFVLLGMPFISNDWFGAFSLLLCVGCAASLYICCLLFFFFFINLSPSVFFLVQKCAFHLIKIKYTTVNYVNLIFQKRVIYLIESIMVCISNDCQTFSSTLSIPSIAKIRKLFFCENIWFVSIKTFNF